MAPPTVADFHAAITSELPTIQENLQKGGEGSLKDATLARLLVVRGGNLESAKEALLTWSTWRATHPIGWVPHATVAPLMTSPDAVSIQPNGRDGQPLIIIRYAALSLSSEKDFQNLLMHVFDVALKQADSDLNPGGRMCLVMDMKGMKQKGASAHMGDIVTMMKTYYPGRMEKVFLHRTPFWFSAVWAVVAATLPPIAKTIIEITSDSSLPPKLQALYEPTVRTTW